eukprot:m.294524 g.294524  ORF g.294524 m.294524 type:complete len:122 (+) comp40749_c1_seq21:600-965(+)
MPTRKPQILFSIGGMAAIVHYRWIQSVRDGAPAIILKGPPEAGKTLCAKSAFSIMGRGHCVVSIDGKRKISFLQSLLSASSFGFLVDDPPSPSSLEELIVMTYVQPGCGEAAILTDDHYKF